MKKKIIFAIVIIVTISIFIYLQGQKWLDLDRETYENTRYGFSMKYPAEWTLGEVEVSNAGRTISSSDGKVFCYAYGFANALSGASGNPQTLDEFIDWLTNKDDHPNIVEVIQKEKSVLSGKSAISLLIEQESGYKKAIYTLGEKIGIGFFCTYPDEATMDEYADKYGQAVMSFKITANLDGEIAKTGTKECDNLINRAITPFKDFQSFQDTKYTEVTITSREAWDKNRLPKQVISFENKGYNCYPMPTKFESSEPEPEGGVTAEPTVIEVEWTCELEYDSYQYLNNNQVNQKKALERQGYTCEQEECFNDTTEPSFVWLCAK